MVTELGGVQFRDFQEGVETTFKTSMANMVTWRWFFVSVHGPRVLIALSN